MNTSKVVFNMKTNLMVKVFSLVPNTGKFIIGQHTTQINVFC